MVYLFDDGIYLRNGSHMFDNICVYRVFLIVFLLKFYKISFDENIYLINEIYVCFYVYVLCI